jgi:hypothetical protein
VIPFESGGLLRILCAFALMLTISATAVAGTTDTSQPATDAAPKTETVTYLGVTAKPVDDTLRAQLDLPDGVGLIVMTIDRKGPAAADLKTHDVLEKLDDQVLTDAHQLVTLIRLHQPGDSVTFTVIRAAKSKQVQITLGKKERPVVAISAPDLPGDLPGVKVPEDANGHIPFDVQLPLGPSSTALSFRDDTYSASITADKAGHKNLMVKDLKGKVVLQSLVDTPEQWDKLPAEIKKHLEVMHRMLLEQ